MVFSNCRVVIIILLLFSVLFLQAAGCIPHSSELQKSQNEGGPGSFPPPEEKWGIEIIGIRLSAAGHMLDFRYRITDPEKASPLLKKQTEVYLIDQTTGRRLGITRTKLGPMRQTSVKPEPNRNYFILFSNQGGWVKQGNKVTVVIGDFKAEDLVVE